MTAHTVSQPPRRGEVFRYEGFTADAERGVLTCRYSVDGRMFSEQVWLAPGPRWQTPAAEAAARLVFLLAGVSYFKTGAPPVIDMGATALTPREHAFLRDYYLHGLGEYAYRNALDLADLRIEGPAAPGFAHAHPNATTPTPGAGGLRVLVPFGGGIDSIVTVEHMRRRADVALFVVNRPGGRFEAIERPAAAAGLPVVRAGREIDQQLLRSAELGFLNGHVPVTGILSAIAVLAAVLDGRDAVVMSNEWSASVATLQAGGRPVNHQYSKSMEFEAGFRQVLADALGGRLAYFSALRPFTELWVARKFAELTQYHATFRSCNRAFHIDPAARLDHWCGRCDKCCFIDLILAPFLPAEDLRQIFGGWEPLADPSLADRFRALLGTSAASKPFECVGDVGECRAAAVLAAGRPDRAGSALLHTLTAQFPLPDPPTIEALLRPVGEHWIPDAYAADDLLV